MAVAVPVAEQDRQRAVAGRERDRRRIRRSTRRRPHELAVGARAGPLLVRQVEVVAEREGRQRGRTLPRRAERGGQRVAAVVAPGLVRALEPAVAETPQQDVRAVAKDREVGQAVAVDVDRVGAGDAREVGRRGRTPSRTARRRRPDSRCGTGRPGRPLRRGTGRAGGRRRSRRSPRRRPRSRGTRRRRRGRCPRPWTPRRSGGPPPPSRRRSSAPGRPPGRRRARPAPRRPRRAPATSPSADPDRVARRPGAARAGPPSPGSAPVSVVGPTLLHPSLPRDRWRDRLPDRALDAGRRAGRQAIGGPERAQQATAT